MSQVAHEVRTLRSYWAGWNPKRSYVTSTAWYTMRSGRNVGVYPPCEPDEKTAKAAKSQPPTAGGPIVSVSRYAPARRYVPSSAEPEPDRWTTSDLGGPSHGGCVSPAGGTKPPVIPLGDMTIRHGSGRASGYGG